VLRAQHEQLPEFTSRFLALLKNNARDPLLGELISLRLLGQVTFKACSPCSMRDSDAVSAAGQAGCLPRAVHSVQRRAVSPSDQESFGVAD
jgi:hypothetical protein